MTKSRTYASFKLHSMIVHIFHLCVERLVGYRNFVLLPYNCMTMRLKETKWSQLQKMQKIRKKWLDVREGRCYLVRLFGGPPLSIRNGGSTRKPSNTAAMKSTSSRLFMQFCLGTPNSATFCQKKEKKHTFCIRRSVVVNTH